MENIVPTGRYRHFKGNEYVVIGTSVHTETNEKLVIYYKKGIVERLFARPVVNFLDKVDPNENRFNQKNRFEYLGGLF